jgi:hypothetical protein
LNDARRKWPNEVVVDLHEAELAVHRTDYMGAVETLRQAAKQYENRWDGETNMNQVMEHLGPSVFSLHGVAEFRVNPENPEVPIAPLNLLLTSLPPFLSLASLICPQTRRSKVPSEYLTLSLLRRGLKPSWRPFWSIENIFQSF